MDSLCTSVTTNPFLHIYGKQFAKESGYISNWLFNSWVSMCRHPHRVAFFTKSYCQSLLLSWQRVWVLFPALSSCEGGGMHSDRISEFGSRWRRHGLIEVSSRSERSRGTARAETGELFSSLRQLLCRSRSPAPGATPTLEYIVFFFFALCFLFLTP